MTSDKEVFLKLMRDQARWRMEESINLLPSENITSPAVRELLSSDFGHRYTLPVNAEFSGYFLENSYRGTRLTDEVERKTEQLACEVFSADRACVQPLSGHVAAMIVIASNTIRGDGLASISADDGGYDGYGQGYLPDILDLRAVHLPFDRKHYNLDADRVAGLIRSEEPKLVILGASFILFPYEMGPIRNACEDAGSVLAYDASHVLGLVAGGEFQQPIREGAEVLYGSTHKSFFGPQGGLIVTDCPDIMESIENNLTWRFVDNAHWNRIAALGQALLEMREFGSSYAQQVIANAKALGKELSERGFPIMFEGRGFTKSHQLLIDREEVNRKYGRSINDLSVTLEKSNIIIDSIGRLGTAEVTRLGCGEKDMEEIADLLIGAIEGEDLCSSVREFRSAKKISFMFD